MNIKRIVIAVALGMGALFSQTVLGADAILTPKNALDIHFRGTWSGTFIRITKVGVENGPDGKAIQILRFEKCFSDLSKPCIPLTKKLEYRSDELAFLKNNKSLVISKIGPLNALKLSNAIEGLKNHTLVDRSIELSSKDLPPSVAFASILSTLPNFSESRIVLANTQYSNSSSGAAGESVGE